MRQVLFLAIFIAFFQWTNAHEITEKAIEWAEQLVQSTEIKQEHFRWLLEKGSSPCGSLLGEPITSDDPTLLIFMSFSVPQQVWIALSKELQARGVFVVRGLPNNSFGELASKIKQLTAKGVTAPIMLDPRLFSEFDVTAVPTFVRRNENQSDKVTGNVTLAWALDYMQSTQAPLHKVCNDKTGAVL